ncbi:MAG: CHASE domain-containing protein [Pseudomonadales bacterium]
MRWPHWLIVATSILLTLLIWNTLREQAAERTQSQFDREVDRVIPLISERMHKYEDLLWSGVAALSAARGLVTRAQWRDYASYLRIAEKYPGVLGIGVIVAVAKQDLAEHEASQQQGLPGYRVHPKHSGPEHLPIVLIEPQALNAKAVGLDMVHEERRYEAAAQARATGRMQITAPIVLVQDEQGTPGFLIFAPYFAPSPNGDRGAFLGMVYAPFIVSELMRGTLGKDTRQVAIRVSDNNEMIYDEGADAAFSSDEPPGHIEKVELGLYGRVWTFDVWSTPQFEAATSTSQPLYVLIAGLTIDGLLLALFMFLSRGNQRALNFADRMTDALRLKSIDLEKSNADLESFAYVASHDLKTPLRGITTLSEFLKEDLHPYLVSPGADPSIGKNLDRLSAQANRMSNLINGILAYSRVGRDELVEQIDVQAMLPAIAQDLGVSVAQISIDSGFRRFDTYSIRLGQVLHNVIGNAFKYHHDPENALVKIASADAGLFYEIAVTDNGPGIEAQYLDRIFGVFKTLQNGGAVDSTGIGLAIVKRTIDGLGGWVRAESEIDVGTTIRFTWPKAVPAAVP